MPFAKNKKANRKIEAIPADKAIAGCSLKYINASMPLAKAAKKNSVYRILFCLFLTMYLAAITLLFIGCIATGISFIKLKKGI